MHIVLHTVCAKQKDEITADTPEPNPKICISDLAISKPDLYYRHRDLRENTLFLCVQFSICRINITVSSSFLIFVSCI